MYKCPLQLLLNTIFMIIYILQIVFQNENIHHYFYQFKVLFNYNFMNKYARKTLVLLSVPQSDPVQIPPLALQQFYITFRYVPIIILKLRFALKIPPNETLLLHKFFAKLLTFSLISIFIKNSSRQIFNRKPQRF